MDTPDVADLLVETLLDNEIVVPAVAEEILQRLGAMSPDAIRAVFDLTSSQHGAGFFGKPEFWTDLLEAVRAEAKRQ
jgi:hypothetical protein